VLTEGRLSVTRDVGPGQPVATAGFPQLSGASTGAQATIVNQVQSSLLLSDYRQPV
jgi:hypothetical protein